MKFLKYLNETSLDMTNVEETGKTTKDKGHDHDYFIRRGSGDGATSNNKGHMHKIKAMVVQKSNGHDHDLKTVN